MGCWVAARLAWHGESLGASGSELDPKSSFIPFELICAFLGCLARTLGGAPKKWGKSSF